MSIKKFGFGSLFLMFVSATSTSLMNQPGIASTSQSFSYKPLQEVACGCPQPPGWEGRIGSAYRPSIYCPDTSSLVKPVKRTCPDFHRTSQGPTTDLLQGAVRLAYDPIEREAKAQERATNSRANDPISHTDRAARTAIDSGRDTLGRTGSPKEALNEAGRAVIRECMSCHFGRGKHNPN